MNKDKSKIIIFNMTEAPQDIKGISVCNEIKYLGIKITNKKLCFKEQITESINKAQRMANVTYSVVEKSCNRLLISKTFWKGLALPTILHASEIIQYTKEDLNKLQRVENKVYRAILRVPSYTATGALRGEIGASTSKARDIKTKLLFIKNILKDNRNDLIKKIFLREFQESKNKWIRNLKSYMQLININIRQLEVMKIEEIQRKVEHWDTESWRNSKENKSTLDIYNTFKTKVREEKWITNSIGSMLLTRARTNTVRFSWRNRFNGGEERCPCCEEEVETLNHFLLHCKHYNEIRRKIIRLQQPYPENTKDVAASILLLNDNNYNDKEIQESEEYLTAIWYKQTTKIANNCEEQ